MKIEWSRRQFLAAGAVAACAPSLIGADGVNPPNRSYRPHTRWWWPGNAVSKSGITWQMEQMRGQGMGGVEIISSWGWYAKGDIPYLSPQWCEMVRHAMSEAQRLDMDVSLTFGPGWSFGGFWVPPGDRSKALALAYQDADAGAFDAELAFEPLKSPEWTTPDENKIVAVVAGRLDGEALVADSLVDLTSRMDGNHLKWTVPQGRWRILNFRLVYTRQENQAQNSLPKNWTVDHFNKGAMQRYCDYLGGAFEKAFGPYFGKTVDSFFCDSFEILCPPKTLLWSTDTLATFQRDFGYDLTRYLPAIWFDIGETTPGIRYDVNLHLHRVGLEATFKTFIQKAAGYNVQARVQPHYRFTAEIIEASGMLPHPETEVTTARFETIADPRKATVAGARYYGRPIVSAESYTFIHNQRYRTSLEEMKRATDAFLRDGITQFYNHGYLYSEEKDVAPSRDMPWANRISHWNIWWRHYHYLAEYITRASYLCRQGSFVGDVLLYSPQAQMWAQRALWGWDRRMMPYGNVSKTLVASGYDYDPVNDDVLQNHARFENGYVKIRDTSYKFVILPGIEIMPIATLEVLHKFAQSGGVVIALGSLPSRGAGMKERQEQGSATDFVFIPEYRIEEAPFSPGEKPWTPTPMLRPPQVKLLNTMRKHLSPDFELEGDKQSDGLTFLHRRNGEEDIYFVTNLQPHPAPMSVTFRSGGKPLRCYDARTDKYVPPPKELDPWASLFYIFSPASAPILKGYEETPSHPFDVTGNWDLTLEGVRFPQTRKQITTLASWTEDPELKHFSGTGTYEVEFDVPAELRPITLDLGSVGCVAEVKMNGKDAGVCWMQPYQLDVSKLVKPGKNHLSIAVTNLLINHVSGLTTLPGVPPELASRYGETTDRYTEGTKAFRREQNFTPLPASGLIGPVRLLCWRL